MIFPVKGLIIGLLGIGVGIGGGKLLFGLNKSENKEDNLTKHKTIGQVSAEHTTDAQWRFMYLLAGKVFDYLSKDKIAKAQLEIGAENKANVVEWLKEKLNVTEEITKSQDWEKFKEVCTIGISEEDDTYYYSVKLAPESRLCFMGEDILSFSKEKTNESYVKLQLLWAKDKGYLGALHNASLEGDEDDESDSPYKEIEAFQQQNWQKSNYTLWREFLSLVGGELEVESRFEEWFNQANSVDDESKTSDSIKLKTLLSPKLS